MSRHRCGSRRRVFTSKLKRIDSLEYDVQPSEIEPSGDLTPPDRGTREVPAGPPPEVAFVFPLDQEEGIALDTEFQIQFTEDMDPGCFSGNVSMQYSNRRAARTRTIARL